MAMDAEADTLARTRPVTVLAPDLQTLPIVLSSPHSAPDYPTDFVARSRLDPVSLRGSEDSFVDEIFGAGPGLGAPLLKANFPRAFVDPNREPYELDPKMFDGPLPPYANTRSPRVAAGLGTIARVVTNGSEIYRGTLGVAEALARIEAHYRPYHDALRGLLAETRRRFGYCVLIDCHSMPSVGGPMDQDPGRSRVEFVLGDAHGTSCGGALPAVVEEVLRAGRHVVARNAPYSGGFITRHYGRPKSGIHALQIEINRALYMDEARIARRPGFAAVAERMGAVLRAVAAIPLDELRR
jgi:N-formylglutamate amidohydrolase